MTPTQLDKLQQLSQVFSQGKASSRQISQLSELLTTINQCNNGRLTEHHHSASFDKQTSYTIALTK